MKLTSYCLAAFSAILITMLLGASSAFAESTALCNVDPGTGPTEVCPAGHLVTEIHEVNLSGSKEKMSFGLFVVECDVLFQGQTTLALDNPQHGVGAFTYTNCSNGCTVTEIGQAAFALLKEGHEKEKATIAFEVRVACMFINCRYVNAVEGIRWGPLLSLEVNGELSIQKQKIFAQEPDVCMPEIILTLRTTPLTKLYVTK
jgi:hypothetical protein